MGAVQKIKVIIEGDEVFDGDGVTLFLTEGSAFFTGRDPRHL